MISMIKKSGRKGSTNPDWQPAQHPPHQATRRPKQAFILKPVTSKKKPNTNAGKHVILQQQRHTWAQAIIPRRLVGKGRHGSITIIVTSSCPACQCYGFIPPAGISHTTLNLFMDNLYMHKIQQSTAIKGKSIKTEEVASGAVHPLTKGTITRYKNNYLWPPSLWWLDEERVEGTGDINSNIWRKGD